MFIGVDYGTKRVGIAVSDEDNALAFPLEIVAPKDAVARILALAQERKAEGVVIGESKDFSGVENPLMARIRQFADELSVSNLKLHFEPEFLTSAAAGREGETAKEHLDAAAAALILQSFLDRRSAVT
jgi:putative holliday junction resolvase